MLKGRLHVHTYPTTGCRLHDPDFTFGAFQLAKRCTELGDVSPCTVLMASVSTTVYTSHRHRCHECQRTSFPLKVLLASITYLRGKAFLSTTGHVVFQFP